MSRPTIRCAGGASWRPLRAPSQLLPAAQVHLLSRSGDAPCIATFDGLPSYQDVEALLKSRPSSAMNKSLFDRLKDEWQFNQDSLKPPQ
jgi:hypothetical protein